MARVFVSHAKADSAVADRIAAFLEQQGMTCWIAPRDVPPGLEYGAAILQGIEQSDVLLLVLSEQSNQSQFVHREVERAVSKAKPILPVRIREIAPSGALEFFISQAQWVDAWQPPMERHLAQLLVAIRALGGDAQPPGALATPDAAPPAPPRRGARRRLAAAAFVLLALAAGLVAWAPWQGGARPGPAAFLAGAWCQPMSGGAQATWRFTSLAPAADGTERVAGALTYTHSADTPSFEAEARWTEGGLTLTWLAPPEMVDSSPLALATDGDDRLRIVVGAADDASVPPEPLTRCAG